MPSTARPIKLIQKRIKYVKKIISESLHKQPQQQEIYADKAEIKEEHCCLTAERVSE